MPSDPRRTLLVAGGASDPQLARLAARAEDRGVAVLRLLHAPGTAPTLEWSLEGGELRDEHGPIKADAAFVRQDVFRYLETKRPADRADARAWKIMLDGWLWSRPQVRLFNRGFLMRDEVNKPLALAWARECGLKVPRTSLTSSKRAALAFLETGAAIYKPIGGGDFCRPLDRETLAKIDAPHLPRPYIVQQRLDQPELRVFRVGKRLMGFNVSSAALDYRTEGKNVMVAPAEVPDHLREPLMRLTDKLGLNYSAADFKTCAETGELLFLEANSNPMFAGFDTACDGELTHTMLAALLGPV